MKTTKILSLTAFLLCFTLNLRAQSGTCGANLTWELIDSTLTITGSGAMDNSLPWSSYSSQIARVSLPEGLTNICDNAFYACPNLQSIVIPNTVTSIGRQAFINCTSLKQVTLSNAVETIGHSAFSSTSITSITLPSSVTSIEDYAFSYCRKLTEITIPGSVSSIGNDAFQYCEQLSKATIEEGVKSIGNSAFQYCSKMTDISLPSSLISIGSSAFSSCSALASVVIPEQITTIEASTFSNCSSLKEVTLPDNILTISSSAFFSCSALASVVIPEQITTIEASTFSGCSSLQKVTLPNNLQTIGNSAFSGCGFAHIDIPNSVTSIGTSAFATCNNLTSFTLPNSLTVIPTDAFNSCKKLTSVTIPEGVTTIHSGAFCDCDLNSLILPNTLQTISNSGTGAFQGNKNLTTVVIPGSVVKIGRQAFMNCSALSQVTLSEGTTTIGACAFFGCSSLHSIILPEGLTTIEGAAFYNCNLGSVSLPTSLTTIEDSSCPNTYSWGDYGTFGYNKNLTSVIIPENVTKIGKFAFSGCSSLKNIALNDNLLSIGQNAFENCSALPSITIPNKVTSIPTNTFYGCSALSEVTLPEGLTTIESDAFYNCTALKTIQLPKTLTSINSAFRYSGLVEIEIPEGVAVLNNTFYECNKLCKVILPSSLTTIDRHSFYNCTNLATITLPQNVRFIGTWAFYGCTLLSSINLPNEITTIESSAFAYCRSLREVTIPDKITSIANYVFQNCSSLALVLLPDGITTIGDRAFENCSSLANITLPAELTFIEYTAFQSCTSLRSITIPSKVNNLGRSIFNGCISLSNVTMLPPTPPTIDNTFSGAPSTLKINLVCGSKEAYMADANWAALTYPINEISSNILTVKSNDNRMGEAYIPTPNTCENDTAIIEALPREGYQFAAWHDGNTDNPRTITVTQDTTYIANFEPLTTYQLTVNYDPKKGHISGTGEYYPNEEATLTVTPLGGYRFKQWGDGNTDNPRTIVMTQDTTLEALFITGDYCGDDILYTFLNDTLALNGTGDMWNLSQYGWNMYADEVLALTLSDGITSLGTNAFMDLMFLSEVTIPASVKTIHKRAFENCRSLSSVTFAENSQLQTIDHWAFYECINLHTLEIPEGVTTIGNGAFYGCAYLDSIVLPASMLSIADNGFAHCAKLSAMTVNAITPPAVDSKTFDNVNRAIPVYVPFGTGATYRATPIWQEFNIRDAADSVTVTTEETNITICETELPYTWYYQACDKAGQYTYTEKYVGTDIDSIQHILNLTVNPTVYTEETITACDSYEWNGQTYTQSGEYVYTTVAANGCDSIVTLHLTISPTLTAEETITACDFYDWNGQTYTQSGDYTYTTVAANGCDSIVTLHLTINQSKVGATEYATICYGETYTWNGQSYSTTGEYTQTLSTTTGCDSVVTLYLTVLPEAIILEESVTINEENLPYTWRGQSCYEDGKHLDSEAFANYSYCDSVIYVLNLTIDRSNKCGDNLYWHYSNNTMTITGSGAMYDDPNLLSYRQEAWYPERVSHVLLPDGITHIGNVAFADCANLTHIDIPNSVTSLGNGAFSWTGLQSVTIPASVTKIGEQVFETCNDLRTILYDGNPTTINNQTIHPFIGCVHLDTIITPAALWHCTSANQALEARYGVPNRAHYIEVTDGELTKQAMTYIAKNSGTMQVLDLTAATNTTLPLGALMNSYRLSTLYLPEQIETVPEMLAEGCYSLTEIIIPASVTEIGNYAFAGCTNVWQMIVDAVVPPTVYAETFKDIDRNISVIVPAGSEEAYRQAAYWQEFFIEDTNSPLPITNCRKLLREDQILILRNGQTYTMMGQLVTIE